MRIEDGVPRKTRITPWKIALIVAGVIGGGSLLCCLGIGVASLGSRPKDDPRRPEADKAGSRSKPAAQEKPVSAEPLPEVLWWQDLVKMTEGDAKSVDRLLARNPLTVRGPVFAVLRDASVFSERGLLVQVGTDTDGCWILFNERSADTLAGWWRDDIVEMNATLRKRETGTPGVLLVDPQVKSHEPAGKHALAGKQDKVTEVSAVELLDHWSINEIAAARRYLGHRFVVSGELLRGSSSMLHLGRASQVDRGLVMCSFNEPVEKIRPAVDTGLWLIIEGRCTDGFDRFVQMDECRLVN